MSYKKALKIATEAHKGQTRWNGDDYITHPIRVASKFSSNNDKIVAILHDTLEDTKVSYEDLLNSNIPHNLVHTIWILTKKDIESYAEYIFRVKRYDLAIRIKIEDIKDNLRDLRKGQRKDKYELALKILQEE